MVLFVWFIIGATTGWLAGQVLEDRDFGSIINCVVGAFGALAGGFLTTLIFKLPFTINSSTLTSLVLVFLGALITTVAVRLRPTSLNSTGDSQTRSVLRSPAARMPISKPDYQPGKRFFK